MNEYKQLYNYIKWLIIGIEDGWIKTDKTTLEYYKVFKDLMENKPYRSM